jgi:hypothetical protein
MTYRTVFDVAHQGSPLFSFPTFGLLFILVGVVMVWRPAFIQQMMPTSSNGIDLRLFGMIFLLFAISWTLIGYTAIAGQQGQGAAELRDPNLSVVEGTVENFVPMPYGGHARESFTVGGRPFSYSDYIITSGFHNAASHGGPIRPGLHVRLSYVGNDILRVEVAE